MLSSRARRDKLAAAAAAEAATDQLTALPLLFVMKK
jgi:hypothetical protein